MGATTSTVDAAVVTPSFAGTCKFRPVLFQSDRPVNGYVEDARRDDDRDELGASASRVRSSSATTPTSRTDA